MVLGREGGASSPKMFGEGFGAAGPALDGLPREGDEDLEFGGATNVKGAQRSSRVGSQGGRDRVQ